MHSMPTPLVSCPGLQRHASVVSSRVVQWPKASGDGGGGGGVLVVVVVVVVVGGGGGGGGAALQSTPIETLLQPSAAFVGVHT